MKAIYTTAGVGMLALILAACGMSGGTNVTVNANANTNANVAKPAEAATVNANTNVNAANTSVDTANANSAAPTGPKRISFAKGADWGSENITLAPGQSKQFVVGAEAGQYLTVEPSSSDVKILMVSKKSVIVDTEGSTLAIHTSGKNDYIFEVRNPGSKEVKTSIRVQITDEEGE